jgi:hypothetical protein
MTHSTARLGRYEESLLLWLLERCHDEARVVVPTAEFGRRQNKPPLAVATYIEALREQGLARVHADGSQPPPDVELTDAGRALALGIRAEVRDHDAVAAYTQRALLEWVRDQEQSGRPAPRLREFFVSEKVFFHGGALGQADVLDAAGFLAGGLLIGLTGEAAEALVTLTPEGRRCLEDGRSVVQYLAREVSPPSLSFTIGTNNAPINVTYGNVITFADTLRDRAPEIGLTPDRLAELLRENEELRDAAGQPQQHGRIGGILRRIRDLLLSAPDSTAAQILVQAVSGLLS